MIFLLLIILSLSIALYLLKRNYEYWEKRGVPGPKPKWIVGNVGECFLLKKNPGEIFVEFYNRYPDVPVVGAFRASTPVLILRDPELIKEVTMKSFSNFRDNDILVDKKSDPIFGRNPFCLKGDEWKIVRAQLTPGFTSGKMKWLYSLLEENSENLVKFINKQPQAFNGDGYEGKELCTRFTLNNVAACAFGLDGKCFEEDNSDFRQLAKDFLTPGSWVFLLFFMMHLVPPVTNFLSISLTSKTVEKKLTDIVSATVKYREENNIVRNDFMHIIMQLKKTCKDFEFTDLDVTAHAASFFGDGYETSSIVMMMILFELATHPEIQAQLREEINSKFVEKKLPYETLLELEYLDAVVSETLRLHPIVHALYKMCTNTHTFTPENCKQLNKPLTVEKGTPVIIPTAGLHLDPKYFEEPESFKPERFLGANKERIVKCTYMPFGEGPRACLGQRFGILQIKCGVAYIIKNFILSLNKKTQVPLKYDPVNILPYPIGGIWIDYKQIH